MATQQVAVHYGGSVECLDDPVLSSSNIPVTSGGSIATMQQSVQIGGGGGGRGRSRHKKGLGYFPPEADRGLAHTSLIIVLDCGRGLHSLLKAAKCLKDKV